MTVRVFIAGIMQGSRTEKNLNSQDYRTELASFLSDDAGSCRLRIVCKIRIRSTMATRRDFETFFAGTTKCAER